MPCVVFILALTLQTNFSVSSKLYRILGCVLIISMHISSTLRKRTNQVRREKLWGLFREICVNGRLLLAIKLLCPCFEICVRIGGVKSQPFTVDVRLLCVLSPQNVSPSL